MPLLIALLLGSKLDLEGIKQVVREVFGNVQTEVVGDWLSLRCVLAPFTHASGRDSRASAGISIHPNGVSTYGCFTCGNRMPLQGMLRKYATYTGEDLDGLIEEIEEDAYLGPKELPEWDAVGQREEELVPLKKSVYLELYDEAAGHPYLAERGISDETARKLQLMVDPADPADGCERILFPVFGPNGDLYGFSGRDVTGRAKLKVRDYGGLRKASCLLGAHLITQERPDKIIVVEGLFDMAKAWECGQPAVAVMHSSLTQRQADILRDFSLPTYLFFDADSAGQKGAEQAGRLLFEYMPVLKTRYPRTWIEDSGEPEGGHWLKDPGEMIEEEFEAMISDSRLWFPS